MTDTTARSLDELTGAEITGALRDLMPAQGRAEWYQVLDEVAERLGSSRAHLRTYRDQVTSDRFADRVKRALNKLAEEGELIKVGKGQRTPLGQYMGNGAMYYTPVAFAKEQVEGEQERAARKASDQRWAEVAARLLALGFPTTSARCELTVGQFEKLLDMAEGRATGT